MLYPAKVSQFQLKINKIYNFFKKTNKESKGL